MGPMLSAIKHDLRFQFRHGFYHAYLLVTVIYIVILRLLPVSVQEWAAPILIFSDPGIVGFFFVGGIILLERGQNIIQNLLVTPLETWQYLLAKVLSLAVLTVLTGVAILVLVFGLKFSFLFLVAGAVPSAVFYSLLGILAAARARTINSFLLQSPLYILVFLLPGLEWLGVTSFWPLQLLPGYPALVLLGGTLRAVPAPQVVWCLLLLGAWCGLAWLAALKTWQTKVVPAMGRLYSE